MNAPVPGSHLASPIVTTPPESRGVLPSEIDGFPVSLFSADFLDMIGKWEGLYGDDREFQSKYDDIYRYLRKHWKECSYKQADMMPLFRKLCAIRDLLVLRENTKASTEQVIWGEAVSETSNLTNGLFAALLGDNFSPIHIAQDDLSLSFWKTIMHALNPNVRRKYTNEFGYYSIVITPKPEWLEKMGIVDTMIIMDKNGNRFAASLQEILRIMREPMAEQILNRLYWNVLREMKKVNLVAH